MYVNDKCSKLIDKNLWLNLKRNYTEYEKAADNMHHFLIRPMNRSDTDIGGIILTSHLMIKMKNVIYDLQYCIDNENILKDNEVMKVMDFILREIIKSISIGKYFI